MPTAKMFFSLISLLLVAVASFAQQPSVAAELAPVPPSLLTARKVFISNAGYDVISRETFQRAQQPDRPYNDLYAAIKKWGKYDLVSTPAESDLVFEIRFGFSVVRYENPVNYAPELHLAIFDTKTHFLLWTITEPVNGAWRKTTWNRNFDSGMTALMEELKALVQSPHR
jgi:hypothetical protein